jgi:hypothetical protein
MEHSAAAGLNNSTEDFAAPAGMRTRFDRAERLARCNPLSERLVHTTGKHAGQVDDEDRLRYAQELP